MEGWRFFQKPGGLELYFLKPELNFTFFFFIFCPDGCYNCGVETGVEIIVVESAIKHPQAPQGAIKSGLFFLDEKELFIADEERSGGVAAIEQPPWTRELSGGT